jgi:predicted secreted protein
MQIGSYIAIYFVVWWISLFMVLPFGVHNQVDAGTVVRGTEPGSPIILRMWRRLLATSILAGILMALLMWGISSSWLQQYWR